MKFLHKAAVSVTNAMGRTGLKIRKHSPEILIVSGIVSVVGAGVLACRATLKAESVLNAHVDRLETIREAQQISEDRDDGSYSLSEVKRDTTVAYSQTALDFAKLYAPSILLATFGIGCLIGSHRILKSRHAGVLAAYKALDEGFKAYRKRVVDEHGAEADYLYKNGLKKETVVEVGEDGKTVEKQQLTPLYDNLVSQYAIEFGPENVEWSTDKHYNLTMLMGRQKYFTDLLNSRGHVFLNEVYDKLGAKRTSIGAVAGWVKNNGDSFVDFGLDNPNNEDFVAGKSPTAILDFNIDGMVYDLIENV